jgi:hypothetical protein
MFNILYFWYSQIRGKFKLTGLRLNDLYLHTPKYANPLTPKSGEKDLRN